MNSVRMPPRSITPALVPANDGAIASARGLTSGEVRERQARFGANAVADAAEHPIEDGLRKLWAPVPWMLEAAIVLQLVLDEYTGAAITAALLLFNALLAFFQEQRAHATLLALRARLAFNVSVLRDGLWTIRPARELVPGDHVELTLGTVVAADVRLIAGSVLLDQSMLTGESVPVEATTGASTFAGALVRRGEAVGEVTATGTRTRFGRTAELVRTAHVVSSQQRAVLGVVRNLAAFNAVVIVAMVSYAYALQQPFAAILPLVLTAVLASIPVALPATFTLAAAVGARALAARGVLATRLSALDEAAAMDVFCSDKTGTLTQNQLGVAAVTPFAGLEEAQVLALAAFASSEGGQDPVDLAIRRAARGRPVTHPAELLAFKAFDPATKMSGASIVGSGGTPQQILKGAFSVVSALAAPSPAAAAAALALEGQGFRVLAVASGSAPALTLVGLIALSDPPRPESAALIRELGSLGVRTVMATGDAPATAAYLARAVGIDVRLYPPGRVLPGARTDAFSVFAGVTPEDKYALIKSLQAAGHIVGMCGDGANDAPALRQAQIGIAVSTATDVAKSAAGLVLTEPGLAGIVAAVQEGRLTFQRIQTYALNSITKKTVQVLFLAVGLVITHHAILTPLLMVLIMITGDFLGMSLTTDNVRQTASPNVWRIRNLTIVGVLMGLGELGLCTAVLCVGAYGLKLPIGQLQTLAFVVIVFGNQATTYTNRERRHLWSSRPSRWVLASSVLDLLIAATFATVGILMVPLPAAVVAGVLAAATAFAFALDAVKVPLLSRFRIS
jgi:H+-transporting ATPase